MAISFRQIENEYIWNSSIQKASRTQPRFRDSPKLQSCVSDLMSSSHFLIGFAVMAVRSSHKSGSVNDIATNFYCTQTAQLRLVSSIPPLLFIFLRAMSELRRSLHNSWQCRPDSQETSLWNHAIGTSWDWDLEEKVSCCLGIDK